jgi:hypothetical protein
MLSKTFTKLVASVLVMTPLLAFAAKDTYMNGKSIYGDSNGSAHADRIVDASMGGWIRVSYGETVDFTNGDKAFTWQFDGLDARPIKLSVIAPADFGPSDTTIYIDMNPLNGQ